MRRFIFCLHDRYRYRYRLFGFFETVTIIIIIIIIIVIVIEVISALSYPKHFWFRHPTLVALLEPCSGALAYVFREDSSERMLESMCGLPNPHGPPWFGAALFSESDRVIFRRSFFFRLSDG